MLMSHIFKYIHNADTDMHTCACLWVCAFGCMCVHMHVPVCLSAFLSLNFLAAAATTALLPLG